MEWYDNYTEIFSRTMYNYHTIPLIMLQRSIIISSLIRWWIPFLVCIEKPLGNLLGLCISFYICNYFYSRHQIQFPRITNHFRRDVELEERPCLFKLMIRLHQAYVLSVLSTWIFCIIKIIYSQQFEQST